MNIPVRFLFEVPFASGCTVKLMKDVEMPFLPYTGLTFWDDVFDEMEAGLVSWDFKSARLLVDLGTCHELNDVFEEKRFDGWEVLA